MHAVLTKFAVHLSLEQIDSLQFTACGIGSKKLWYNTIFYENCIIYVYIYIYIYIIYNIVCGSWESVCW